MVRLTAEFKQGFLQVLFDQSQSAAVPLTDALKAFQQSRFSSVSSGRLIVTHAGAGKSTTFQVPRLDQYVSQEEIFSLARELRQIYDDSVTTIENNPSVIPTAQLSGNCFTDGTGTTFAVTTSPAHGLRTGSIVRITSPQIPLFNGEFSVTVTSPTVFTCVIAIQNQVVSATALPVRVISLSPDLSDPNIYAVMQQDDRLQDINKTQPDFTTLLTWNR